MISKIYGFFESVEQRIKNTTNPRVYMITQGNAACHQLDLRCRPG